MNRKKTFIYLVPKNCISGYRICTEKYIIDELQNFDCKILKINRSYNSQVKKILKKEYIDGIIFSSLKIIWKNQKILTFAKKFGIKIYWWYFDTAMSKPKRVRKVNKIAPQVDIFFNKDKEEFQRYRELGTSPVWLDQGVPDICKYHKTQKPEFDLVFIGSLNKVHRNRLRILQQLDSKYNLTIFTPHQKEYLSEGFNSVLSSIKQSEIGIIAAKTKIFISMNTGHQRPYCWSDRIHLLLGSGAFCISEFVEGIEESYTNEKDCLFFHNLNELYQLIDYWIRDDLKEEREKIRYQGFLTAHKKHSYKNRIIEFLKNLET